MSSFLCLYREVRAKRGLTGGLHDPTHAQYGDSPYDEASQLGDSMAAAMRGVQKIIGDNLKPNTVRQYLAKLFEFFEFSDHVRPNHVIGTRYLLTESNIFEFIWYNAFRGSRPTGTPGKRKKHRENDDFIYFDSAEYDKLQILRAASDSSGQPLAEPSTGVCHSHLVQVKCALKWLFDEQIDRYATSLAFRVIWTPKIEQIATMVKDRKARLVRFQSVSCISFCFRGAQFAHSFVMLSLSGQKYAQRKS